ncbi:MAG: ATP-binding protein, partial [Pirellulaceae bacterium]
LEEAAIDGIPAICIDPKGDLGNLLLTFPQLKPSDFLPYLEQGEATKQGVTIEELAAQTAERWEKGLASWEQNGARIQRLRDAVDMQIYTPGSNIGTPLTALKSFDAPPQEVLDDDDAFREMVSSAASGILALLGIDADPLSSREHILLATIFDRAWRSGRDLDLAELIRSIQTPGIDRIGVLDLESFMPGDQRAKLANTLNNLLASPSFAGWLQGEPLDIQRLLYTPSGKPRISILSISHLNDAERMFFVTLLLSEFVGWMRSQPGTSSLRAILYMDEIFGYFPPTAKPPSKTPMRTLLKQARAFGIGIVLATQNPADIDYKG